jgi:hypothetical protein
MTGRPGMSDTRCTGKGRPSGRQRRKVHGVGELHAQGDDRASAKASGSGHVDVWRCPCPRLSMSNVCKPLLRCSTDVATLLRSNQPTLAGARGHTGRGSKKLFFAGTGRKPPRPSSLLCDLYEVPGRGPWFASQSA